MKNKRNAIICAVIAAAMLLSGCQENKVVENGGVETTVGAAQDTAVETTEATEDTTIVESSEETTTTTTSKTNTTTTSAVPENDPEESDGVGDAVATSEITTAATTAPVQTTAATAGNNNSSGSNDTTGGTGSTGNNGNSGNSGSTGGTAAQTTRAAAQTTAPQTAAQTFATTQEHVSGYRYGTLKKELKHDIDYMKDLNTDFVGWLTVEDTPIDLPVVQGSDNKFYLEHDFYGAYDYTKVGATFADCHVPITETSRPDNIVIYGHNIRTGVGLAKVTNYYPARYGSLNFYINHPIVHFDSITGDQSQYVVFAGMFVNTDTKHGDVFNYHRFRNFDSESIFYQYFEAVFDRSVFYNPDLDIKYGDKFLTLSTCYYPFGANVDTRFVAFARQIRPGETKVTTKNAYINRSPLYFDYYYKVNGGSWAGRKWSESLIQGYSAWKKKNS